MGLFSKKKKYTRLSDMKKFHRKKIKQAVLRKGVNSVDEVILGKNGGISVTDDNIILVCDGHEVFRCSTKKVIMAELMSLDGVDIRAYNDSDELTSHVIAYYEYYNKAVKR